MSLLFLLFWDFTSYLQRISNSRKKVNVAPPPKEPDMNSRVGKRLQNKVLKSIYDESDSAYYSANAYASIFKNVLTEEKCLKVTAIVMSIRQNSTHPITAYYGFPASKIKAEYIPIYGLLDWNKLRLECATAMSKKRKKKAES